MFSKNKKIDTGNKGSAPTTTPQLKPSPPSIISADLKMVGDLKSAGEIHIDGTVLGDIHTKTLLVGETANITGEIFADSIRVHGQVNGQIKARSVTLAKTAHVVGDILHEDLSIETGAFLEGLCKHMSSSELAEKGNINLVKKPEDQPAKQLGADGPPKVASNA